MRVENHTEHLMRIPIMGASGADKKHVAEVDHVALLPGVNDVDPAKWEKVAEIDLVKRLVAAGVRRGGILVGDPKKSLRVLSDLSEREALDTVEDTVDAKLLALWGKNERRQPVLDAIAAQVDKIDPKEARNTVRG